MICHKKVWTYCKHKSIFGLAQKNLDQTKTFWDLHRRTRRQYVVTLYFTFFHFHAVHKFASIYYVHMWVYVGQFGLSCFYKKDTKLARFVAKTLHRKLLFCWLPKSANIWLSKLKSIWIFLILFLINLAVSTCFVINIFNKFNFWNTLFSRRMPNF